MARIIAVGGGASQTQMAFSDDDGVTWNDVGFDFGGGLQTVGYNAVTKTILAVRTGSPRNIWRSVNGGAWEDLGAAPGAGGTFNDARIACGNGRWVILGGNGQLHYSDDDGDTWTACTGAALVNLAADGNLRFFNGYFVATGGSQRIIRSTDGIAFINSNFSGSSAYDMRDIGFLNGAWFAGGNGRLILRSPNADPASGWAQVKANDATANRSDVLAYVGGAYFAYGGNNQYVTSATGSAGWGSPTGSIFPVAENAFSGITTETGRVVIGSVTSGQIVTTDDGTTFDSRTSPFTGRVFEMAYIPSEPEPHSSSYAFSGPVGITYLPTGGQSEDAFSGPLHIPLQIEPPHESEEAYSGPLTAPLFQGGPHSSAYAYSGPSPELDVPLLPFDPGDLPDVYPPLMVVHMTGPFEHLTAIARLPDIAIEAQFVDFHWQPIRQPGDSIPPTIHKTEQGQLVIEDLRPGRFRYRFFAQLATGETAIQDFLLLVRDSHEDEV